MANRTKSWARVLGIFLVLTGAALLVLTKVFDLSQSDAILIYIASLIPLTFLSAIIGIFVFIYKKTKERYGKEKAVEQVVVEIILVAIAAWILMGSPLNPLRITFPFEVTLTTHEVVDK